MAPQSYSHRTNRLLIFLLISPPSIISQSFFKEINPFDVIVNGEKISNTFTGGMNNPEVQFVDLDGDNDLDAMLLMSDNTFQYYKNVGNSISPSYEIDVNKFANLELRDWFYFVDIDADEDYDLFTGSRTTSNFISLYRNIGDSTDPNFVTETDTVLENTNQAIFAENISNPVFADVDGDGDFDFIAGNQAGTLVFYENIGSPINYEFQFITNQWQDIIIIGELAKVNHHGASSLEFADINSDSDYDLFWGDFFHTGLYFLENQGTPQNPNHVRVLDLFPTENNPVNTRGFNMSRFSDIDSDGDLDMFISELWSFDTPNLLMYFENLGDANNYEYQIRDNNFIETLDLGVLSYPAFTDLDNDNDFDLIIGAQKNRTGSLNYFENIGSNSNPSFELKDTMFAAINFDSEIAHAFGDLDNDGDKDLVLGTLSRFLLVYENVGNGDNFNFELTDTLSFFDNGGGNLISTSPKPFLIDVENDGDLDIVVGGFNGEINLIINEGTVSIYNFSISENHFGGIDVGNASAPALYDFNNDNILDLAVGNLDGEILFYENSGTTFNPNFSLTAEPFINENFGSNSVPLFVDIDNDSDKDFFVGNVKGGLYFYRNDEVTGISNVTKHNSKLENFIIETYPNPFNASVKINVKLSNSDKIGLYVYNLLGQKIKTIYSGEMISGEYKFDWNATNDENLTVATGNYIVVLELNKNIKSIPISLIK